MPVVKPAGLRAGRALRDAGIKSMRLKFESRVDAADWKVAARRELEWLAKHRASFTTDDVLRMVGMPPGSPNAIGALVMWAVRTKRIVRAGDSQAQRSQSHARRVGLYERGPVWR